MVKSKRIGVIIGVVSIILIISIIFYLNNTSEGMTWETLPLCEQDDDCIVVPYTSCRTTTRSIRHNNTIIIV